MERTMSEFNILDGALGCVFGMFIISLFWVTKILELQDRLKARKKLNNAARKWFTNDR